MKKDKPFITREILKDKVAFTRWFLGIPQPKKTSRPSKLIKKPAS